MILKLKIKKCICYCKCNLRILKRKIQLFFFTLRFIFFTMLLLLELFSNLWFYIYTKLLLNSVVFEIFLKRNSKRTVDFV